MMTDTMTDSPPENTLFYTRAIRGARVGAGVARDRGGRDDLEKIELHLESQPQPKRSWPR